MQDTKQNISGWLAQQGGPVVNLIWIATIGLAIPAIWPILGDPVWMNALGLVCLAFPAIAGLVLVSRQDHPFERFALALFWTALAAAVATSGGGITGAGVLAFLLPPAVAAASGGREAITKAAALSGVAALVVGVLQFTGFIRSAPTAIEFQLPFMFGTVLVISVGFAFAAIRSIQSGDRARREAEHGRIRSQAFDAAPAALLACDEDGHILAASNRVRELSPGLPRDMAQLPLSDLGYEDEDRINLEAAGRRAASKPLSELLSVRGLRGRPENMRFDASPMPGGSVSVFSSDETIGTENSLREAEEAREQALEETRSKSQYLASVSHELRTPLNAIIGFSDVMKARLFGPMPARYAEYADLIHESGQHLMDLIGDVLDMSKIEADRYELVLDSFDVSEVISITTKLMRLQAEEAGLSLVVEGSDKAIDVKADRKALRQILLNLLSNAVKFTPKGGAVVVMSRVSGPNLVLAVGDSGIGINSEEVDRLGQPYRQASSAQDVDNRGTGLGLSLVKALAELHDGTMTISSRKGEGTTITVTLPVLEEARGTVDNHPSLDVHRQIERAQKESKKMAATTDAA